MENRQDIQKHLQDGRIGRMDGDIYQLDERELTYYHPFSFVHVKWYGVFVRYYWGPTIGIARGRRLKMKRTRRKGGNGGYYLSQSIIHHSPNPR